MPPTARLSGTIATPTSRTPSASTVDTVRQRVQSRLTDKLEMTRLRRMPASFMQQEVRKTIEQLVEGEGARLGRLERELLIEDLFRDAIGFGPLEEIFRDLSVQEILVLSWQTVLTRRGDQSWLPSNVKFRDEDHFRQVVSKASAHADPLGGESALTAAIDGKLPNGFRVLAVTPPAVLNLPPYVVFLRGEPVTGGFSQSSSVGMAPVSRPSVAPPASASIAAPTPRPAPTDPNVETLNRLRMRITEHISSRLAAMGVANTSRLEVRELQRVISAYVAEFCQAERVKLSEVNEVKMVQEILASLRPI